jgi:hypothetical protein
MLLSLKTVKKARERGGKKPQAKRKPKKCSSANEGATEACTGVPIGEGDSVKAPAEEELFLYQTTMDTFVLGFLMDIASAENLFHDLCEGSDAPMTFLRLYRTSQDHLECFFGAIRATGGCNNKPSAGDFKYAMRKCTLLRVRDVSEGNCMLQVKINRTFPYS